MKLPGFNAEASIHRNIDSFWHISEETTSPVGSPVVAALYSLLDSKTYHQGQLIPTWRFRWCQDKKRFFCTEVNKLTGECVRGSWVTYECCYGGGLPTECHYV